MALVSNFIDTNILIYAFGSGDRAHRAQTLLNEPFIVSVQTLNEFANVARKKLNMSWNLIGEGVEAIIEAATFVASIDANTTLAALRLAQRYNFSFYDAAMIGAALSAGCAKYYSEDLQHGLVVDGQMIIVNPFR